ncbi:MAG: hypothetical protein NTV86_00705 [Planctomycetota bacterium]|nr:hypothetical protein [Planctomycetota bacterium]
MQSFYGSVAWGIEDVRKHRPGWTDEMCREFLRDHGQSIADAMTETGWEIIEGVLALAEQEEMPSWRIAEAGKEVEV